MKITTLLTQYLYTNQRLDLPGIGSFILDPSSLVSLENSKQRSALMEGISFQHHAHLKEPTALIAYISEQSGKMKALAAADLDSHIELAQQFLNIGKPFTFDGIGTLVKLKPGEYEFTPITVATDKIKDYTGRESSRNAAQKEDTTGKYESFLSEPRQPLNWRQPVIGLFVVAGLALAIWGGYAISKKANKKQLSEAAANSSGATPSNDTNTVQQPKVEPLVVKEENYKYVLEVAKSKRALKRYNQLLDNRWDVKLETADSVQYKVYMLLPALNSDTTRVLDSLTVMTGRKVYIEHNN